MKAPMKVLVVTLISGLIMTQFGPAFCQKNNDPKPLNWNFDDMDLIKVIEAVAQYTGKNFNVDPAIKGKVTLITHTDIPPELAYQALESILASRGYALIPVMDGNMINVVSSSDAPGSPVPTGVAGAERIEPYENVITQIVPVKFGLASDLASVLDPLKSKDSRIQAYVPANVLIITEKASQFKRLVSILESIDVPGFEEGFEIIPLKHQSADILAMEIMDVLSEEAAALATAGRRASTPIPPSARTSRTVTRRVPQVPEIVGAARTPLRIIPDLWTNSLIVVAVESMMVKVKKLIEQLDVATPFEEGNLHVYIVQNADVVEVLEALESLVSGASGTTSRPQPGQPAVSGAVEAFAKEVRMSAYEPTNALLITASPQDWKILQNVLEKIDVPERQVYVEAVIMEVTITDGVTVGVDLAALAEEDVVAASTFGDLANFIAQGPLGFTGGVVGVLGRDMDITNPLTGETVRVPRVPVLLTAIQTVTDLEVLSAPTLLTTKASSRRGMTSGTGARPGLGGTMGGTRGLGTASARGGGSSITVGKDVPVVRGSARPLSQEAISPTLYNTVGRQKVGIVLEVAPHIIAEDYIKLQLRVEVSDTIASEVGIDPNISGPTFSISEIVDTVVIRDGYMGVIGGLMSQAEDTSRSQVPILGDIPGLGFFFRKKSRSQEKRNLVVIITPHIVKSGEDLEELTARYRKNYDLQKLEMYGDLNFWRKVFRKEKITEETSQTNERRSVKGEHADRVLGRKSDW